MKIIFLLWPDERLIKNVPVPVVQFVICAAKLVVSVRVLPDMPGSFRRLPQRLKESALNRILESLTPYRYCPNT